MKGKRGRVRGGGKSKRREKKGLMDKEEGGSKERREAKIGQGERPENKKEEIERGRRREERDPRKVGRGGKGEGESKGGRKMNGNETFE